MARVGQGTGRSGVRETLRGWSATLRAALRGPGPERTDALLLVKAAVAAAISWQVVVQLMHSPTPFYAPLAALLVVDRTVVRSIWQSIERVVAVVVGMSTAWLVGTLLGLTFWSVVLVLLVALLIGRWDRLGEQSIQVPIMALLSLLTLQWDSVDFTYVTLVETAIGGAVGIVVNAAVLAPMHLTAPRRAVSELSAWVRGVLEDVAAGLREGWDADRARDWNDRATRIGEALPGVLDAIETGRESTRFNLRHRLRPARIDWEGYRSTVEAVRRTQWPIAGITRTLADAADDAHHVPALSAEWLVGYAGALEHLATATARFGIHRDEDERELDEHLDAATSTLDRLADDVWERPPDDPGAWPVYGMLLIEARRLVAEVRGDTTTASVPSDSGPLRRPMADAVPPVRHVQDRASATRERLRHAVVPTHPDVQRLGLAAEPPCEEGAREDERGTGAPGP